MPEFRLSEQEALALAEAMLRVEAEFHVQVPPKLQAITGLLSVVGAIYFPRIGAIARRSATQRAVKDQAKRDPFGFGTGNPPQAPSAPPNPAAPPGANIVANAGTQQTNVVQLVQGKPDGGKIDFGG